MATAQRVVPATVGGLDREILRAVLPESGVEHGVRDRDADG